MKTNFKGHAETCLLIIFSSLGCVLFPPMVSSNFLGGHPNHEKILSRHGPTTHGPPLFFSQWLLGILDRSCKNLEKIKKKSTGVHEWPGHRVSFFFSIFVCFLGLCLIKLIHVWFVIRLKLGFLN